MSKQKNLPNLTKQIKKVIGKLSRESKEMQNLDMQRKYNIRKDPNIYQMKFDALAHRPLCITKSCHKLFIRLLVMIEEVFRAKGIKYNKKRIEEKLDNFITDIVFKNKSYDLDVINNFIGNIC